MNKSNLKALFINAKANGARYIGVRIQTEGSSQPEIIINPRENFDTKFQYYAEAYDDDLVLISAKGKKDIRITGIAQGNTFEDIEFQLCSVGYGWKQLIVDAIDRIYEKMIKKTPPKDENERVYCEGIREQVKTMFIKDNKTAAEARFICEHIEEYENLIDICMNGNDLEFKRGLVRLQRMQNEYILKQDTGEDGENHE